MSPFFSSISAFSFMSVLLPSSYRHHTFTVSDFFFTLFSSFLQSPLPLHRRHHDFPPSSSSSTCAFTFSANFLLLRFLGRPQSRLHDSHPRKTLRLLRVLRLYEVLHAKTTRRFEPSGLSCLQKSLHHSRFYLLCLLELQGSVIISLRFFWPIVRRLLADWRPSEPYLMVVNQRRHFSLMAYSPRGSDIRFESERLCEIPRSFETPWLFGNSLTIKCSSNDVNLNDCSDSSSILDSTTALRYSGLFHDPRKVLEVFD